MNHLHSNSLSVLLLLMGLYMESAGGQSAVIQTPSSLNVVEGTNLRMECKISIYLKIWYAEWYVNKAGVKTILKNTTSISIVTNTENKWSRLILKRADMTDSGIYICEVGYVNKSISNGTQVTVNELTNLMVNQTLGPIVEKEGTNVTIECSFRIVSNYNTMYVRWHKDGKNLTHERDSLKTIQDLEKGFASLTLKNMKEDDSGSYVCEVGITSRNLSGSGIPSQVVITAGSEKKRTMLDNTNAGHRDGVRDEPGMGVGMGAGVGAGVGIILLALLIGFVWRKKQSSQGAPLATSEPESVSAEQARTHHPPLASQASDVMYAKLHFNKRDVKPDAEVLYAEVKVGRK